MAANVANILILRLYNPGTLFVVVVVVMFAVIWRHVFAFLASFEFYERLYFSQLFGAGFLTAPHRRRQPHHHHHPHHNHRHPLLLLFLLHLSRSTVATLLFLGPHVCCPFVDVDFSIVCGRHNSDLPVPVIPDAFPPLPLLLHLCNAFALTFPIW